MKKRSWQKKNFSTITMNWSPFMRNAKASETKFPKKETSFKPKWYTEANKGILQKGV